MQKRTVVPRSGHTPCIMCEKKRAKMPKERPLFCSLRCGFDAGVMSYKSHAYCDKHKDWYNSEECPECRHEKERAEEV